MDPNVEFTTNFKAAIINMFKELKDEDHDLTNRDYQ